MNTFMPDFRGYQGRPGRAAIRAAGNAAAQRIAVEFVALVEKNHPIYVQRRVKKLRVSPAGVVCLAGESWTDYDQT